MKYLIRPCRYLVPLERQLGANNDYQQTIEKCNGVIERPETELEYSRQNAEKRADKNA